MKRRRAEYADDARHHLSLNRNAVLSTISHSVAGYPFGSLAPYDIDTGGRLVIYVSLIAEHYKNLKADPRASLFVMDAFGSDDPQANARVTAILRLEEVPASEREAVQASYEARFPGSIDYEIAHNFVYMRGQPERIRWIGGFGDITWISGEEYAAAKHEPIAYAGMPILQHMNEDHADALNDIASAELGDRGFGRPLMTDIRAESFTISLFKDGKRREIEIAFPSPLEKPEDARGAMIRLVKEARGRIGKTGR